MGLDLNMDFLGGLAQKTNYANLMLQKQQMAEANKAKELQYANTLNTLKEQDTNTALKFLEQQDKAEQDLAGLAISDYDKKKLLEQEAILREKHISPLMEKYKGNPLEALKSEEGKAASLRYTNELKSHPDIQKYKRDANIVSESEKRQALGYEPLKVFRPETKQWYTPEEQVQAKEAGLLPSLEAHPYVKPMSFDAASYFQKLNPPTDKEQEYYKLEGRLPVNSDVYAQQAMEKQYPSIPIDTPRYQEYYNAAKNAYEQQQKQGNSLYYKLPENEEEKAQLRANMALYGYKARKQIDASIKAEAENDEFEAEPIEIRGKSYVDSKDPSKGFTDYTLEGAEISIPQVLKSDQKLIANDVYIPQSTRIGTKADDDLFGTVITVPAEHLTGQEVILAKGYKPLILPVGPDNKVPLTGSKRYKIYVPIITTGDNKKVGYTDFSVAEPFIKKAGYDYKKLYNKLIKGVIAKPQAQAQEQEQEPAQTAQTQTQTPATTKTKPLTKGSLNDI